MANQLIKPKFEIVPVQKEWLPTKSSLMACLLEPISWFRDWPGVEVKDTKDGPVIYKDNKSDILAVAHLDTVDWNWSPRVYKYGSGEGHIQNAPQLDDRLGVWIILFLLPKIFPDLNYDILLTDSEEVGASTAKDFQTEKKYNWMFEFDRRGTDVVGYNYESRKWNKEMTKISNVGSGSFTDICYLETLGCKGMNIGTGYYRAHQKTCYANLAETYSMAYNFGKWALLNQNRHFGHPPPIWARELDTAKCNFCKKNTDQDYLCKDCQKGMVEVYADQFQ